MTLMSDNGREIITHIASVDFWVGAELGESMRKAEADCVGNITMIKIAAAISIAFDNSDAIFFVACER